MSGLYLLLIALVWFALVLLLAYKLTLRVKNTILRVVLALLLIGVLLPLPLVDEFVGERQFEQLCADNAAIQVDRATAVGKTVYFVPQPTVKVEGTWVPIVMKPKRFVDATTGETVVSYNELMASGGLFVRIIRISEGGVPLIFRSTCVPADRPGSTKTFEPFGIKYIEPPVTKPGK